MYGSGLLYMIDQLLMYCNDYLALPATVLFFVAAIVLTIRTGFPQITGVRRFFYILDREFTPSDGVVIEKRGTTTALRALATAMGSTIGMGNVVGPSIAVMLGGPGALFWMIIYIFFGSAMKFAEVTFAVYSRVKTPEGTYVGGPMEYLKLVSNGLARWYALIMMLLFAGWSALQSNTLAAILSLEGVPELFTGTFLMGVALIAISGGIGRVGLISSKLVPVMFLLYFTFCALILLSNPGATGAALHAIISDAFCPSCIVGGFMAFNILRSMQIGMYKGIFVTEAGLGTASIAHATADVEQPTDQGLLALFSMISDALLSLLSGVVVLVSGVWKSGVFRSTLVYEAFRSHAPIGGQYVLIVSVALFVITTVIGNTFNGTQNFISAMGERRKNSYIRITGIVILCGAVLPVHFMWNIMDVMLACVAIPNVIAVVVLAIRYPSVLSLKSATGVRP